MIVQLKKNNIRNNDNTVLAHNFCKRCSYFWANFRTIEHSPYSFIPMSYYDKIVLRRILMMSFLLQVGV